MKMTSFLVGREGGGGFLGTDVSQGNDVCPWISCATLYTVMVHGQSASFYCSRAQVELMILVKPRKRKSGNKVFSSLKAPQKHCTDLKIETSRSSKRTTALRQPSGFQLASNVIYSTKCYKTLHEKNTKGCLPANIYESSRDGSVRARVCFKMATSKC